MQSLLKHYPTLPQQAQHLVADFLSLEKADIESEANKELMLAL
jgi:hypothetical protein